MIMKIVDEGTVFAGQEGTDRQSCAFPGICVMPSGRLICGFRAAPKKGDNNGQHILLAWSDDEGQSWNSPQAPFIPPDVDGRPGLFRVGYPTPIDGSRVLAALAWVDFSDPPLPFFNETTEGLLDTRVFVSWSEDEGTTWSKPEMVDTTPFNVPVPLTGPVLRMSAGRLICQFELNKPYYDTSEWRHSSVLMFSKDEGRSWPEYVVVSSDPENRIFYWDQRPGLLADGTLLDVFWTYDRVTSIYLNIHARESLDGGRTWSDMWDTGVSGQPAAPISLPGGYLGLVYVDRTQAPVIKMRASHDKGRTWPEETEIFIHQTEVQSQTRKKSSMQDAWVEMGRFSLGLPATAVMAGGDVIVVYYSGRHTDHTDIRWCRIRAVES